MGMNVYLNEGFCEKEVLELNPVIQHLNWVKTLNVSVREKKEIMDVISRFCSGFHYFHNMRPDHQLRIERGRLLSNIEISFEIGKYQFRMIQIYSLKIFSST